METAEPKTSDASAAAEPWPGSSTLDAPDAPAGQSLASLPFSAGPASSARSDTVLPSAEGYMLIRPHESGGLGIVDVARDIALDREVAVKRIRPELADHSDSRRRFVHEARITGQLEHPNIVPVHALGYGADGRPYYAMKLVRGRSLAKAIDQYHQGRSPRVLRDLLRRFISVCQAVAYAHSKGIIHRDLKPANIMLGDYGETMILDWGLSKQIANPSDPAGGDRAESSWADEAIIAGQILGTPGYLAPEQAVDPNRVGPSADVYSLGAILYKILCHRTPKPAYAAGDISTSVVAAEPLVPPTGHCPTVPRALEHVCLKAMSARPENRQEPLELAKEIDRWLSDEPVLAWREPWPARMLRWARHHRPAVAGSIVLLISLTIALAVNNVMVRHEKSFTEAANRLVTAEGQLANFNEHNAQVQTARGLVFLGNVLANSGQWDAAKSRDAEGGEQLAGAGESRFAADMGLWNCFRFQPPPLFRCNVNGGGISAIALAPGEDQVLMATQNGALQLGDFHTGILAASVCPLPSGQTVNCLAYSANGDFAATGDNDGTVVLWDARHWKQLRIFQAHRKAVTAVAFAGKLIISGGDDETMKLLDPDKPDPVFTFHPKIGAIAAISAAADGSVAFAGGLKPSDNLCFIELPTRAVTVVITGDTDYITSVSISPDGTVAVAGGAAGTVCCWQVNDIKSAQLIQTFKCRGHSISAVAISSDDHHIFSGTRDGESKLWNLRTNQPEAFLAGPRSEVAAAAFNRDGSLLAVGNADGTLTMWNTTTGREAGSVRPFADRTAMVSCVALTPDNLLAVSAFGNSLRLWDIATGEVLAITKVGDANVNINHVAISAAPYRATYTTGDGNVFSWDLKTDSLPQQIITNEQTVTVMAFSPNGQFLATGDAAGTVELYDLQAQTLVGRRLGSHDRSVVCLSFSGDGRSILTGGVDRTIRIWSIAANAPNPPSIPAMPTFQTEGRINCLASSLDNRYILAGIHKGQYDYELLLWDLRAGGPPKLLAEQSYTFTGVAFTPDSQFGISCNLDQTVTLWDLKHGAEHFPAAFTRDQDFESVAFAANAGLMISGGYDKPLSLWEFNSFKRCGDLQEPAQKAFESLRDNHGDGAADLALGEWYALQGRPNWAALQFKRAADAGTQVPAIDRARCAWMSGDHLAAAEFMNEAKRQDPSLSTYLNLCLREIDWETKAKK